MGKMGSRQLQYYRHDYAKVCMTGLLGCRWHRYQQSTKGSRKRDIAWTIVCLLVFLFVTFYFYFCLIADNDSIDFNWYMYQQTDSRFNWFLCVLAIFATCFTYVCLLMLLSLCHMLHGHQLYTHPVHLVCVMFILLVCVAFTIVIEELWSTEWAVIYASLQVFGPFLQLGVVSCMTMLSWLLLKKWFKIAKYEWKLGSMCVFCMVMLALYLSPLLINSPCVIVKQALPRKPKILAHKGASRLAPENTVIAFERAALYGVYGIETDVRISTDGTPFIMHDTTLHRTTDIDRIYPDLAHIDAANFSIAQLKNLRAGSWFIEHDPAGNVDSLSDHQKSLYYNARIPTLLDVLEISIKHNFTLMMDIYQPYESHDYYNTTFETVVDVIAISGINKSQIIWLSNGDTEEYRPDENYQELVHSGGDIKYLQKHGYDGVHLEPRVADSQSVRAYRKNNLTTSVYMVNKEWLYSLYWCVGIDMIATDYCHTLSKVEHPIWHLAPGTYRVIWVVTDCVSVVLILIIFIIHRYRLNNAMYHPERASLNSHSTNGSTRWGQKRSRRSMKEKLLMRDVQVDAYDFEPEDELGGIDSNGYNVTVNETEGRELAQSFHGSQRSRGSERSSVTDGTCNRSSFISNVESGEFYVAGGGGNRLSYLSTDSHPHQGETTDVFPNGRTDHLTDVTDYKNGDTSYNNLSNSTNPYQTETQFT